MAQGSRPERVGDQIRAELGTLLAREVKDPHIGFTTITRVRLTNDLQLARVYYTTLGDAAARRTTARALKRATPFIRRALAGRLRLRRVPELTFTYDESVERADRVEQLLQDIRADSDEQPQSDRDDRDGE